MTVSPPARPRTPERRYALIFGTIAVALIVSLGVAASLGAVHITTNSLRTVLESPREQWGTSEIILAEVRLPRVATAALVGAGLAVAGFALQLTLRNPLAEPYLLGISSGASLGAVSVILLGVSLALPLAALAGGMLALATTLGLSGAHGSWAANRVILAGVAVTALFSATTSLVIFTSPDSDSYRQVLHWLLGSLASSSWTTTTIAGVSLLLFGGALAILIRLLSLFRLGDGEIRSLGVSPRRARAGILTLAALLAAGMVSVSGAIGFVGLIVPHLVRTASGGRTGVHLALSALVGALLLVWADTFSRIVVLPRELPVGITTSLLGALAFAVIMLRNRTETT